MRTRELLMPGPAFLGPGPAARAPASRALPGRHGALVEDYMTADVEACGPGTDLASVARMLARRNCGFAPVVEGAERKVVGVITDRDICMTVSTRDRRPSEILVRESATRDVHTVSPKDEIRKALDMMRARQVRRLPVVDVSGSLVGILSLTDIIRLAAPAGVRDPLAVDAEEILRAVRSIGAHPQSV